MGKISTLSGTYPHLKSWLMETFPPLLSGHSCSIFSITWRKFSGFLHWSPNLWSESRGPGYSWAMVVCPRWLPASFPVFSLIWRQQVPGRAGYDRGNAANKNESNYSESSVHLLVFISVDKWYYLSHVKWDRLRPFKDSRKGTCLRLSLSISRLFAFLRPWGGG